MYSYPFFVLFNVNTCELGPSNAKLDSNVFLSYARALLI